MVMGQCASPGSCRMGMRTPAAGHLRCEARRDLDPEDLKEHVPGTRGSDSIAGRCVGTVGSRNRRECLHQDCGSGLLNAAILRNGQLRPRVDRNRRAQIRAATRFDHRGGRRRLPGCTHGRHGSVLRHAKHRCIAHGQATIRRGTTVCADLLSARHGCEGRFCDEYHRKRQSNGLENPFHDC
jgi:hypothetical protein